MAAPRQRNVPVLLSGGNPQIPKGLGNRPVQDYIDAMPGWKEDLGRRLDALITETVPDLRKAVKWNQPFYGAGDEDHGWFATFRCFTEYVKITFFRGVDLDPVPPGAGKQPAARWLDVYEDDDVDRAQLVAWIDQANRLPGETL